MTATPTSRLAALATRREKLLERQELLDATPRPLAEARAAVADLVARAGARVQPPVGYLQHRDGNGGLGVLENLRRVATNTTPGAPGPFELLCAAAAPAVTTWLTKALEASYADRPKPVGAAEYEKAAGEIAVELAAVERELAEMWWTALDEGMDLPPPELSIEAILGVS